MHEAEDLSSSLPPPRDDEPASLRSDILDELADHLSLAGRRETLRQPDASDAEIRQAVLESFGDPTQITRRLYLDAMKELTDLLEEAVLTEFDRLTERGGVLGAMERMYQRNKIQEESLVYEHQKHTGELPIVGVNTFLNKNGSPTVLPNEVIRSTKEEKEQQIQNLQAFWKRNESRSEEALAKLKQVAISNGNLFEELMETVKYCSLGQITHALYEVGGQYRRSM